MSTECPWCGDDNDEANIYDGAPEVAPRADDVAVCINCHQVALFTGFGKEVRKPTPNELTNLMASRHVRQAIMAVARARSPGVTPIPLALRLPPPA